MRRHSDTKVYQLTPTNALSAAAEASQENPCKEEKFLRQPRIISCRIPSVLRKIGADISTATSRTAFGIASADLERVKGIEPSS